MTGKQTKSIVIYGVTITCFMSWQLCLYIAKDVKPQALVTLRVINGCDSVLDQQSSNFFVKSAT